MNLPWGDIWFYGKVKPKTEKYTMEQPVIYDVQNIYSRRKNLRPVYPLVSGVSNNLVSKL